MSKFSPVKSVETWTARNDGRKIPLNSAVTTPFITGQVIAVRHPKGARNSQGKAIGGQFLGATNYPMRSSY